MTKNKNRNDRGSAEKNRGKERDERAKNDHGSVDSAKNDRKSAGDGGLSMVKSDGRAKSAGAEAEQVVRMMEVELGGEAVEAAAGADEEDEIAAEDMKGVEGANKGIGEKGIPEDGRKRGGFWHRTNISYPWLKFAAAVLVVIVVLAGGFGVASLVHGHRAEQVADSSNSSDDGRGEGAQDNEAQGTEDDKDEQEGGNTGEGSSGGTAEKPVEGGSTEGAGSGGGGSSNGSSGGATGNTGTTVVPSTKPVVVPESATGKKLIALTFDDGPSPANTGRLLDILKEKNVKATFFVLGNLAERNPALVQREEAEGHEVGSHTPYHNQQTKLSAASIQAEAATMNQIFINVLGHSPAFTRPPYGSVNDTVRANLAQPLIMWSIDPEDWKYRNAATVRANVVSRAHDGAIALMHDIHATTVDAVPGIIDDLRAQGYEFLTVSELAKARGVALQNGYSYYNFRP